MTDETRSNVIKLSDRKPKSVRECPKCYIEAIEALADYIVRIGIDVSDRAQIEEVAIFGEVDFLINRSEPTCVTLSTAIDCAIIIASDPEFVAQVQADLRHLADKLADENLPSGEEPPF